MFKRFIMKILVLLLFFATYSFCYPQQPTIAWQKCVGGIAGEYGWSIKQLSDGNGNFIACGYSESTDGDFSNNHGNDDAALIKIGADGTVLYTKLLGGSEDDEAIDIIEVAGGYVMIGSTESNNGDVSGNHGDRDIWVVKTDLTGNIIWQKCYGGSYDEDGEAILQTSDGGYIFVGSTYSSNGDVSGFHGDRDIWVVKISATGTLEWQKCFGGSAYEEGYAIAQASNGDFVIAGYTASSDGNVTGAHGGRDSWIFRISSTGTLIWQKCLGGINTEEFNSIYINTDGTIMALGYSNSTGDDLSGAGGHGDDDFWVVKLSATGNVIFSKCYGGPYADQANRMAMTTDGNYVLCGLATANGGDVSGLHTSMQGPDIWVVKIDAAGTLLWQKCLGGYNQDEGLYICATADGNCVAAGFTYSNGGDVSGNHGSKDMWFVKLAGGGSDVPSVNLNTTLLYPNPAKDILYLEEKTKSITITTVDGKTVFQNTNFNKIETDLSFLRPGLYLLTTDKVKNYRFVKD